MISFYEEENWRTRGTVGSPLDDDDPVPWFDTPTGPKVHVLFVS